MDEPPIDSMNEQDRKISAIVAEERAAAQFHPPAGGRPADVEDIFAGRLLQVGESQSAADAD